MSTGTRPTLARAFRRAALPLASYYAVTLALPIANGAAQSGTAFATHAVVVLVLPPLLITLAYAVHRAVQVLVRVRRSPLPLARRFLPGRDRAFVVASPGGYPEVQPPVR